MLFMFQVPPIPPSPSQEKKYKSLWAHIINIKIILQDAEFS
jgi:hypothetical protein